MWLIEAILKQPYFNLYLYTKEGVNEDMKKSKRKQLKLLITLSTLIAVSCGACTFLYVQASKNTVQVPVVTKEVKEGEKFEFHKNYELSEVPNIGLSPTLVKKAEEIEGVYALRKFNVDEYIFSDSVATEFKRRLPDRIRYGGVAVNISLLTSGGAELKPDDFVRGSIVILDKDKEAVGDVSSNNLPTTDTAIVVAKELGAIRVLGIYDGSGKSVSAIYDQNDATLSAGASESDKQTLSPQYIIFDATKKQEALLLQANYSGKLHLTLLPEEEQEAYRKQWGISMDEESAESEEAPITAEEGKGEAKDLDSVTVIDGEGQEGKSVSIDSFS